MYTINSGPDLIQKKLLNILSKYTKFKLSNFTVSDQRVSYEFDAEDKEAEKCMQFVYSVVSLLWDVEILRYTILDELIRTLKLIQNAHQGHFLNVYKRVEKQIKF